MPRLEGPTPENYGKDLVYGQRVESHRVCAVRASAIDSDDEEATDNKYAGQRSVCLSGAGRGRDLEVGWRLEKKACQFYTTARSFLGWRRAKALVCLCLLNRGRSSPPCRKL